MKRRRRMKPRGSGSNWCLMLRRLNLGGFIKLEFLPDFSVLAAQTVLQEVVAGALFGIFTFAGGPATVRRRSVP